MYVFAAIYIVFKALCEFSAKSPKIMFIPFIGKSTARFSLIKV